MLRYLDHCTLLLQCLCSPDWSLHHINAASSGIDESESCWHYNSALEFIIVESVAGHNIVEELSHSHVLELNLGDELGDGLLQGLVVAGSDPVLRPDQQSSVELALSGGEAAPLDQGGESGSRDSDDCCVRTDWYLLMLGQVSWSNILNVEASIILKCRNKFEISQSMIRSQMTWYDVPPAGLFNWLLFIEDTLLQHGNYIINPQTFNRCISAHSCQSWMLHFLAEADESMGCGWTFKLLSLDLPQCFPDIINWVELYFLGVDKTQIFLNHSMINGRHSRIFSVNTSLKI